MTETELKLALREDAAERLRTSEFWRGLSSEGTASNRSIYFDTPDQRLRRHGFTLRQRQVGNRFEQTLKKSLSSADNDCGGDNGGLSRREWTWPLETGGGPLIKLDEVSELKSVKGLQLGELGPLCEVAYQREKRIWRDNGAAVELALDVGEIRANGHTAPISELELELLGGAPTSLFVLARSINQIAPVYPFFAGKGERGLALLKGAAAEYCKPATLHLNGKNVLDAVLADLFANCLEHLLANLECARAGTHPEGIHQVRVALRRLRTVLKILEPILPQARTAVLEHQLGELASALSPARDLDVVRALFASVAEDAIDDAHAAGQLDRLVASLQAEAQVAAKTALSSAAFGALVLELSRWRSLHSWCDQPVTADSALLFVPARKVLRDRLDRQHGKVRKRGSNFDHMTAAERHRLRLSIKRLRYGIDLFGSLYDDKAVKSYRATLTRLQDRLGHDNDVIAAAGVVDRIIERRPSATVVQAAGAVLGWLRHDSRSRQGEVTRDWQHFVAGAPPWR